MGWLTRTHYEDRKLKSQEIKEELIKVEFKDIEVVSIALRNFNSEAYVVTKLRNNPSTTYMNVVLIYNTKNEIGFKVMDEAMGPFYYNPPKYQLKQLSPTDNESANEWRLSAFGSIA